MPEEKHNQLSLEDKLYRTRFETDSNPHIDINPEKDNLEELRKLLKICPSEVYKENMNDRNKINVSHENCLECGACRKVINNFEIFEWRYPLGGKGVKYRHG
mgnify:CR=1 FL=1